jgi:hypothetical protein
LGIDGEAIELMPKLFDAFPMLLPSLPIITTTNKNELQILRIFPKTLKYVGI